MSWKDILKEESTGFLELNIESEIKEMVLDLPDDRLAGIRNGKIGESALIPYIELESIKRKYGLSKTPLKIRKVKVGPSLNKPGKDTTITIVYSVQEGIHDKSPLIRNKEISFTLDDARK